MKRLILLIIITLLLPLASFSQSQAADYRKIKIAVLDFQQNGAFDSADVGKIVAEWLTTSPVETGRFDVIERRLLQQIVEEQKMGKSGLVDPGSASRLGRLLGVKTVVSGREVKRINTDKRSEAIALSPNGRFLLAGRDKNMLVYRLD